MLDGDEAGGGGLEHRLDDTAENLERIVKLRSELADNFQHNSTTDLDMFSDITDSEVPTTPLRGKVNYISRNLEMSAASRRRFLKYIIIICVTLRKQLKSKNVELGGGGGTLQFFTLFYTTRLPFFMYGVVKSVVKNVNFLTLFYTKPQ